MGDRCYVEYHFPEAFGDLVERLFAEQDDFLAPGRIDRSQDGVVTFVEEEVNYGDTSDVEEILGRHAIPYDVEKGRGDEYDARSVRARVARNEEGDLYLSHREWYEEDNAIDIPELSRKLRTEGMAAVAALIKEREDFITVLPIKESVLEPEHEALIVQFAQKGGLEAKWVREAQQAHLSKKLVNQREIMDWRVHDGTECSSEHEVPYKLTVEDDYGSLSIEVDGGDRPCLAVMLEINEGRPALRVGNEGDEGILLVFADERGLLVIPEGTKDEPEQVDQFAGFEAAGTFLFRRPSQVAS